VYVGYCKNCIYPAVDEEWDHGRGHSLLLIYYALVGYDHELVLYFNSKCVRFQTICFRYFIFQLGIIVTLCWTPMYLNYVQTLCNMWCVNAELYTILVVRCWWFEILRGFDGLPELFGLKYNGLIVAVITFILDLV
jgi:hypothetical protein